MMNNDDLNKSLWEAIGAWRELYFGEKASRDQGTWERLLNAPTRDFDPDHEIFCAIEQDHLGVRVVMTDATNHVVERLKISPPYTRED